MGIILVLAAAVAVAWLWNDTLKAREQVLLRCRRACREMDVQLLDETVAVHRLGVGRNSRGRIAIRRTYSFEFSTSGSDRWHGHAVLLGRVLKTLQMENPDGMTILGGSPDSTGRKFQSDKEHHGWKHSPTHWD